MISNKSIVNFTRTSAHLLVASALCVNLVSCADKPGKNQSKVPQAMLTAFQDDFQTITRELHDSGLELKVFYTDQKISNIEIIPHDYSRRAEERIETLHAYNKSIKQIAEKYVDKEVTFNKKDILILTQKEVSVLLASQAKATEIIEHFQAVIPMREKRNFMHSDEYMKFAGKQLEDIKDKLKRIKKTRGVSFVPPIYYKNSVFTEKPKIIYSPKTVASYIEAALGELKPVIKISREMINQGKFKGKIVPTGLMHFPKIGRKQLRRMERFEKNLTAKLSNVKAHNKAFKEIESKLTATTGLVPVIADSFERYDGVTFETKAKSAKDVIAHFSDHDEKRQAIKDYEKDVEAFFKAQKTQSKRNPDEYEFWTTAEQARVYSNKKANGWAGNLWSIDLWRKFYEGRKSSHYLNYAEDMQKFVKWQKELLTYIGSRGLSIDKKNLPLQAAPMLWLYNNPLRNFKFTVADSYEIEKLAEALYATSCFLKSVHDALLSFVSKHTIIPLAPSEKLQYTEKHLKLSNNAIVSVHHALKNIEKPKNGPCLDLSE